MHWAHILGILFGTFGYSNLFLVTHTSGCREASCEVLTTAIRQRASILQCLDRPIENALGVVKTGGKIGEEIIGFWP